MLNKILTTIILALSVVFLFGAMAFAKTKNIDVLFPSMVGKTLKLKPGDYRIDVVNNKKSPAVKFYNKDGKLVGQALVKPVNEARKNHQTTVAYTTIASNVHAITEISPSGWKENLYFPRSNAARAGSIK
ncbi:MAG TPA: hypothetical protein VFJ52_10910 [Terriglobia bacterium]|nr:hypothetical protein [Terriglobia bacterium]